MIEIKSKSSQLKNEKCETTYYDPKLCKYVTTKKVKHKTLDDAILAAKVMNTKPEQKYKAVAYKCASCGFYHIGRNGRLLSDKDREKFKEYLKNERRLP